MKSRSQQTLEKAIPIVAAVYGRQFGVKVVIGGAGACTDGNIVQLPEVDERYPRGVLWGFTAHECAHVRMTNFAVPRNAKSPLHKAMWNTFEDGRIEQWVVGEFPGTKQDLDAVVENAIDTGMFCGVETNLEPIDVLSGYCLYFVRSQILGQSALEPLFTRAESVFQEVFPGELYVRLRALLVQAAGLGSSEAAMRLAEKVVKLLEDEKDDAEKQQKPDQPTEQQPGEQSPGAGQSQGDGQSKGDKDQQGNGSDKGDNSKEGNPNADDAKGDQDSSPKSGDADEDGATGKGATAGASADDAKQAEKLVKALSAALDAGDDELPQDVMEQIKSSMAANAQANPGKGIYKTVQDAPSVTPSGDVDDNGMKLLSSKVRTRLQQLIEDDCRERVRTTRSGRRINANKVCRLTQGDTRVFNKRDSDKRHVDTAFMIAVDMSSSMARNQDIARKAALATALALEKIHGVDVGVVLFSGSANGTPVRTVLQLGQRAAQKVGSFQAMVANGGTPMAEGIWKAGFELLQSTRQKKVLMVIGDGAPNDYAAAEAVLKMCGNSGFDLVGLGIRTDALARLIATSVRIDEISELQEAMFRLSREAIVASAA